MYETHVRRPCTCVYVTVRLCVSQRCLCTSVGVPTYVRVSVCVGTRVHYGLSRLLCRPCLLVVLTSTVYAHYCYPSRTLSAT